MNIELQRFGTLFDRLVQLTSRGVAETEENLRTWKPELGMELGIGTRIPDVTIKSLFIHLAVTDHLWFGALASCESGTEMPRPLAPELTAKLSEGDYVSLALEMHEENTAILRGFDEATLAKEVTFVGRIWTVMGFLWSIYGHRSYHLGHIDMYWRQSDKPGPDFHQFHPKEMA